MFDYRKRGRPRTDEERRARHSRVHPRESLPPRGYGQTSGSPCGTGIGPGGANVCSTPGQRVRSGGGDRGLARGGGRGPIGGPFTGMRASSSYVSSLHGKLFGR